MKKNPLQIKSRPTAYAHFKLLRAIFDTILCFKQPGIATQLKSSLIEYTSIDFDKTNMMTLMTQIYECQSIQEPLWQSHHTEQIFSRERTTFPQGGVSLQHVQGVTSSAESKSGGQL